MDYESLRFIQRVLESDAPQADRQRALEMVRELRRQAHQKTGLTEEQIYVCEAKATAAAKATARSTNYTPWAVLFTRAIEQAHGILGTPPSDKD